MNFCDDRQEMTRRIKEAFKYILSKEALEKRFKEIEQYSDYDFWQLVAEIARRQAKKQYSNKDFLNLQKKLMTRGIIEDPAVGEESAELMDHEEAANYWHDINNSQPSDIVKLSWKEDKRLCSFWKRNEQDDYLIPSDLFFAGNIPILDIEIEVDERDNPDMYGFGTKCLYRITIFENYRERISNSAEDDGTLVGAITFDFNRCYLIVPLYVIDGVDVIPTCEKIGYFFKSGEKPIVRKHMTKKDVAGFIYAFLATWYGVQIFLLHPAIKDVLCHPVKEKIDGSYKHIVEDKKRVAKYIRRHVVTEEEIDECINHPKKQNRQIKTFAWYVIGHWRHFKNGKKVFINGYWKGPLREVKQNLDSGRERIISNL